MCVFGTHARVEVPVILFLCVQINIEVSSSFCVCRLLKTYRCLLFGVCCSSCLCQSINAANVMVCLFSREAKAPNVHLNGGVPASVPHKPQKLDTGNLDPASH